MPWPFSCFSFFAQCCVPKPDDEDESQEGETLLEQRSEDSTAIERSRCFEDETNKRTDFQDKFVHHLMKIYDDCKKFVPKDAKDAGWSDWFKDIGRVAVKIGTGAGLGAAVGLGVSKAAGSNNNNFAISAGVAGALYALWDLNNEYQAREKAEGFLALVRDIRNDRNLIKERMHEIAQQLSNRFGYAIARLENSDEGVTKLAAFFALAIAAGFPDSPESHAFREAADFKAVAVGQLQADIKYYENETAKRITAAVKYAIPEKGNSIYQRWFFNVTVRVHVPERDDWSIEGLLLRSPVMVIQDNKYIFYVRDGIVGKANKVNKFPPQRTNSRPMHYLRASTEMEKLIYVQIKKDPYAILQSKMQQRQQRIGGLFALLPIVSLDIGIRRLIINYLEKESIPVADAPNSAPVNGLIKFALK